MRRLQRWGARLATRLAGRRQPLPPQAGYDLWAPTYDADGAGNPLLGAERRTMEALLPSPAGQVVLDLACGTGHYARRAVRQGARLVVGLDLSAGMLRQARQKPAGCPLLLVQADQARLPLADRTFDLVIHALGAGYAPDLAPVASELARVLRSGGRAFVSELHPQGAAQGWRRTFVHRAGGERREVVLRAYPHRLQDYRRAFARAGFVVVRVVEVSVDEGLRPFFVAAHALERYVRLQGKPLLVLFELRLDPGGATDGR